MNEVLLNIEIETEERIEDVFLDAARAVCLQALRQEACPMDAMVSLTLTGADQIREINRDFRGIDAATDVLSFPMLEFPEGPGDFSWIEGNESDCLDPESGCLVLGDIVLNMEQVHAQAEEYGHSLLREFSFLIAHSMLHLCGYDHMTEEEAAEMEEGQERVLSAIGLTRDRSFEDQKRALALFLEEDHA